MRRTRLFHAIVIVGGSITGGVAGGGCLGDPIAVNSDVPDADLTRPDQLFWSHVDMAPRPPDLSASVVDGGHDFWAHVDLPLQPIDLTAPADDAGADAGWDGSDQG